MSTLPVTLLEWLRLSPDERTGALDPCLERLRAIEPSLHAWVQVQPVRGRTGGPLHGVPFGAKDIMETSGLVTEFGSSVYRGRTGGADAAIVTELKQRGAVLLGKTATTSFAYITPAATQNPKAPGRTPGGSSSGSAAAVAAGMVPLALGTQTKGSVLRPASYCGVTGFKPSFGLFSMDGVLPVAPSLDTLGFFTHTPDDMLALWTALERDRDVDEHAPFVLGVPEPFPDVEPAMKNAIDRAVSTLRECGGPTRTIDIAARLTRLAEAAHVVMFYEGARAHRQRYEEHGDRLADLAVLVREGLQIPDRDYAEARRYIDESRREVEELFASTPVIAVPAATGPAPSGLGYTGDPAMNAPWTALGTPAISIPLRENPPLGLQLTARHGDDSRLLRSAVRVWEWISSDR